LIASTGTVVIISGVGHLVQGCAALMHDSRYASPSNYAYRFTLTGWSGIYLVTGRFTVAVGVAVLGGKVCGRVTAVLLALLSMAVNFLFLPWYPQWSLLMKRSLLMISLEVVVIGMLVVYQLRWNELRFRLHSAHWCFSAEDVVSQTRGFRRAPRIAGRDFRAGDPCFATQREKAGECGAQVAGTASVGRWSVASPRYGSAGGCPRVGVDRGGAVGACRGGFRWGARGGGGGGAGQDRAR